VACALKKATINSKINRILRMQDYFSDIEHRSGQRMPHVDALSHVSVTSVDFLSFEKELQYRQLADPQLHAIAQSLKHSDHDKYQQSIKIN